MCVDENARGKGVAKFLVNYLKEKTKALFSIGLKCRKDYEANKIWPHLNFQAIHESPGRSKEGHPLVTWRFNHRHDDLFTAYQKDLIDNKSWACIDANIFFDLKDNRNEESMSLQNGWLLEEIELCLTDEIYNEILRSDNEVQRSESRKFAKHFTALDCDENEYLEKFNLLKNAFPCTSSRDESDLKQIAKAVAAGSDFFITRDENILSKSLFVEEKFYLSIKRPSDLIIQFDELIRSSIYQPQSLSGTIYESRPPGEDQIDQLVSIFLNHKKNENANEFKSSLRHYFSSPKAFISKLIFDQNTNILALVISDKTQQDETSIPIFRIKSTPLKKTLSKHLSLSSVLISTQQNKIVTSIHDYFMDEEVHGTLLESNFLFNQGSFIKINLKGIYSLQQLKVKIEEISVRKESFNKILEDLQSMILQNFKSQDTTSKYFLEKYLWPAKVIENQIPAFIVPIKPKYAAELFDENLLKSRLWGSEKVLVLNSENVYYRSKSPEILKSPARVCGM